jgi:hypothetical protein
LTVYVESLLKRLIGATEVVADKDDDYPIRYKDALYYVRVVGDVDPVVQVFSVAVSGIAGKAGLFKELNTINSNIKFARIFWILDQVLVESEMVGEGVEPADFDNACRAVATITDHFGPLLAEKFGGKTAFADEKSEEAAAAETTDETKARIGQYL